MRKSVRSICVLGVAAWSLAGCGFGQSANGNGADAQGGDAEIADGELRPDAPPDSPRLDAFVPDAFVPDAFVPDASIPDAFVPDAFIPDAFVPDAFIADAALPDAAVLPDASTLPDASVMPDASTLPDAAVIPDAALPDAALPDAALPDAALPDAFVMPDAAVPVDAGGADGSTPPATKLRLVAGNLTSGNGQSYLDPGIHIFKGLHPDVAMIQEFNVGNNSTAALRTFVDQAFGTEYTYARGAATGQIPNGIVSRYPIIAQGEWIDTEVANRTFVWAQIDIPGPIDLYAISVHLLSSSSGERSTQGSELVQHIQALPAGAYVVLGGDFNTDSRSEAVVQKLSSVLVTTAPYPVDQAGLGNTNANRNKPYDWVLTSSNLNALETPTLVGNNSFPHGFVADTRVYAPIADLTPAIATDSAASNMQHMGVARDFQLSGMDTTAVRVTSPNGGEIWSANASQQITWTASGTTSVKIELSTDGTSYTTLSASTSAAAGQFSLTAPNVMTASARVRITAEPAGTPTDTSDAAFSITTGAPPVAQVFINEVLANEAGSNTDGEFVELVNNGTVDQDISGWTISDSVQVRHAFASGTVLRAGQAIVVFGGPTGIPAGLGNAVAASTGQLSLTNSADAVTLRSPTAQIDAMSFTSSQPDGVSLNRSPDGSPSGSFALHTALSSLSSSPGTRVSGASF